MSGSSMPISGTSVTLTMVTITVTYAPFNDVLAEIGGRPVPTTAAAAVDPAADGSGDTEAARTPARAASITSS